VSLEKAYGHFLRRVEAVGFNENMDVADRHKLIADELRAAAEAHDVEPRHVVDWLIADLIEIARKNLEAVQAQHDDHDRLVVAAVAAWQYVRRQAQS
jgi:hypothetical protein